MASIHLYLDEDSMRTSIVRSLRARQIPVTTAAEAQLLGRPDEEHLAHAIEHGYVVFSFNRGDFARLHAVCLASEREHSGIIVSDQLETGVIVRRLLRLLSTRSASDMRNRLEYLSNWR